MTQFSQTQQRALSLLSTGANAVQTASALGLTESAIAQFLSDADFTVELAAKKFSNLQAHNTRDLELDKLEDTVIEQLKSTIGLVMRPMELARILQIVNAARRRGTSSPDAVHAQSTIINLSLPTAILNRIQVNGNNQVVQAGAQELVTIQSAQMLKMSVSTKTAIDQHEQSIPHYATPRKNSSEISVESLFSTSSS